MFHLNQNFQIGKEHVFKNNQSFQQSNNENVNMKGTKFSMLISKTKTKQIVSKKSEWNYSPLKFIVLSKII